MVFLFHLVSIRAHFLVRIYYEIRVSYMGMVHCLVCVSEEIFQFVVDRFHLTNFTDHIKYRFKQITKGLYCTNNTSYTYLLYTSLTIR